MTNGIKFDEIRICDNLIIDGHHRYVSSILAGMELNTTDYLKTSGTLEFKWEDVEFVDEEWDTDAKIHYLNKVDAEYNNISLEEVSEMIK